MKVAFFSLEGWEREYLLQKIQSAGIAIDPAFYDHILNKDQLPDIRDAEGICVFVDSKVDAAVIGAFPNLKWIVTRSTGYDHIDLAACKEKGISVSSVPSYGENTVAEFAFALLLSLSRKVYEGFDRIRETGQYRFDGLRGFDLKGKTIGVVGTGRIGRNSIKMAKGFGMEVLGFDAHQDSQAAQELGFQYVSLDELYARSDVITLHVPAIPETFHMVNRESIAKMKKGVVIINTSRGTVIETEALVEGLQSGQIGGAGLDVLEEEGVIKDELSFLVSGHPEEHNLKTILANHVLFDMPNVVITPHNAFNTKEALMRILDTTFDDIKGWVGGAPVNLVPMA